MKQIKLNASGGDVVKLQNLLSNWGYAVDVTGTFDKKTDIAVRKFQQLYKLGADGIVGTGTWKTLLDEKLFHQHQYGPSPTPKPPKKPKSPEIPKRPKSPEAPKGFKSSVGFKDNLTESDRRVVSSKTIELLKKVADKIGQKELIITSTIRTPEKQARIMYNNLANNIRIRYAAPGREVVEVYDDSKAANMGRTDTINRMVERIEKLSHENKRVSRHCVALEDYKRLNVIDVSYTNLGSRKKSFIEALLQERDVSKIIHDDYSLPSSPPRLIRDKNEPCIHLEIKQ